MPKHEALKKSAFKSYVDICSRPGQSLETCLGYTKKGIHLEVSSMIIRYMNKPKFHENNENITQQTACTLLLPYDRF